MTATIDGRRAAVIHRVPYHLSDVHHTEYACSLKGVALLALARWTEFNALGRPPGLGAADALRMGRLGAYAEILRHITGDTDPSRWAQLIDPMA